MICAIIGDRDISPRLVRRLEREMSRLIELYRQVHFLIGERCGFEKTALEIAGRLCRENYFVSYNIVMYENSGRRYSVTPEAVEMIKCEYMPAWRDRWMLKQAETAIICMDKRPEMPARMTVIDLLVK